MNLLREYRLKATPIRQELLKLLKTAAKPLSCEEILEQLQGSKSRKPVNLVTVYRNMNLFAQKGLVTRSDLGGDRSHFEICDRKVHRHLIICTECKQVTSLPMCGLEDHMRRVRQLGFEHVQHRLEFYGVCKKCS